MTRDLKHEAAHWSRDRRKENDRTGPRHPFRAGRRRFDRLPHGNPPDRPHPRFRESIHAAHRAPPARAAGLLRGPSVLDAGRRDPPARADRRRPLGGPQASTTPGAACREGAARTRHPRCWVSATACSSSPTCSTARSNTPPGRSTVGPESRSRSAGCCSPASMRGDRVDEPRRPRHATSQRFRADRAHRPTPPSSAWRIARGIYCIQFHPEVRTPCTARRCC